MLNIVMLNIVMLNIVMLNPAMLSIAMSATQGFRIMGKLGLEISMISITVLIIIILSDWRFINKTQHPVKWQPFEGSE